MPQVKNPLKQVKKKYLKAMDKGIEITARKVLKESRKNVPLDKSTLKRSAKRKKIKNGWKVSYKTPYASFLQRNAKRIKFKGGRKGTWLIDAVKKIDVSKEIIKEL